MYVYAQGAERISDIMLTKALEGHMVITDISAYDAPMGELQEEWRAKPVRGNKKFEVKADTTAVFVHPLGEESLQHVTRDYVADSRKPLPGIDVFFISGLKLYSLHQNINFRARKGDKNARVCCTRNGWITVPREEAYACSDRKFRHTTSIISTCIQTVSLPTRPPPYPSKGSCARGGATRFLTTSLSA